MGKNYYYFKNMVVYWRRMMKLIYRFWKESEFAEITTDQLLDRINSNQPPLILDVRSTPEFNGADGHIPNARSIPIRKLSSELEDLQSYREKEIVTICPGGGLSLIAVDLLVEADFVERKRISHNRRTKWKIN
ncbi:MAG: rhodanese-like domain-containing protein [Candidatus Hodarchaeales archaeon]|jgi:rhodanese-related sulfurtransferase